MDARQIIIRPVVTEKSYRMKGQVGPRRDEGLNAFVFEVHPKATKVQIRKAVEEIYDVKVTKINTLKMPGKWRRIAMQRRTRPMHGRSKDWKKAVVFLAEGHSLTVY